jgi:fibronectin-binding autotransporter adhesin
MYLYSSGIAMTGNSLIFENGAALQTYYNGGNNPINNQVTFNGVAHLVLGDHNETFSNVVSGVGGFVLDYYNHDLVFTATNTYTGPTIIGSSGNSPEVALLGNASISQSSLIFFGGSDPTVGHIDVSGGSDQTLTLASGQTLEGVGGVNGSLVVSSGATISPGGTNTTIGITTGSNPVGTLAASDNVTLNGTTIIKLDGTSNDVVEAAAKITYGGTLNLANISGSPLIAGQSFQIFSAATYAGSFANITPSTPGAGLAWNTSQLGSGIISVVAGSSAPVIGSVYASGGNLIFSGTGGTNNGPYFVLTSTNLLTPLTNWTQVATGTFSGSGGFSVTNALSTGSRARFYIIKQ